MNTHNRKRPLKLNHQALLPALLLALSTPQLHAGYDFTVVDFPSPTTQETFGVLDLNDSGDVFYYVQDINLYDAYLYRSGTKVHLLGGSEAVIGGSANHNGSAILWIQVNGTDAHQEVLYRKGAEPFALVATSKSQFNYGIPINSFESWQITGVRIKENDDWVMSGMRGFSSEDYSAAIHDANGMLAGIVIGSDQGDSGIFGSLWSKRLTREVVTSTFRSYVNGVALVQAVSGSGDYMLKSFINRNLDLAADWWQALYNGTGPLNQSSVSFLGINQNKIYQYRTVSPDMPINFTQLALSDNRKFLVALGQPNLSSSLLVYLVNSYYAGPYPSLNKLLTNPTMVDVNNRGDILLIETSGKVSVYRGGRLNPVYTPGMNLFGSQATSFTVRPGCFNNRGQIAGVVTLANGIQWVVRAEPVSARLRALEVVQSIQDWNNSVPLVAGKKTYVRAYLEADSGEPVTAVLRGRRPDDSFLPGPSEVEPTTEPWNTAAGTSRLYNHLPGADVRGGVTNSLNFVLPVEWRDGELELTLEPRGFHMVPEEPAELGGIAGDGKVNVKFLEMPTLPVIVAPVTIHLRSRPETFPAPDREANYQALALASRQFPVAPIAFRWTETLVGSPSKSVAGGGFFVSTDIGLAFFVMQHSAELRKAGKIAPNDLVMGTVRFNPFVERCGQAIDIGAADGWAIVDRCEGTFSHELGHLLGRPHAVDDPGRSGIPPNNSGNMLGYCGEEGPEIGGEVFPFFYRVNDQRAAFLGPQIQSGFDPVDTTQLQQGIWGFDPLSHGPIDPTSHFELMSYCGSDVTWPSIFTYTNLLKHIANRFGHSPSAPRPPPSQGPYSRNPGYRVVAGFIERSSNAVAWLPARVYPQGDADPSPGGDWEVRALDANGILLASAAFSPAVPSDGGASVAIFRVELPNDSETQRLEVRHSGNIQSAIEASAHAPEVQVLWPNGGEKLDASTAEIRWQATDADGDELSFNVQYSTDGGVTWSTLGMDLESTNLVVDCTELHASTNALIRVLASDGVLCSSDQSDGRFSIPDRGPQIIFLDLPPGQARSADQPQRLQCVVLDREEGELTGANVIWRSDRDGQLGVGSELTHTWLTPGTHRLTLTATDGKGNATVFSNTIVVLPAAPPTLGVQSFGMDGSVSLAVGGPVATLVVIETSTNLVDWQDWETVILEQSPQVLPALASPQEPARFFRVRGGIASPAFLQQPDDVALDIGDTLHLSAQAVSAEPVDYYWLREGNPIVGVGNGPTLTITNLQVAQSGLYSVLASNRLGTATSRDATVACRVALVTSLTNVCYQSGSILNLQCSADGSPPIAYQWFKNNTALAGATNATLAVGPMTTNDLGSYVVGVTNGVSTVLGNATVIYQCPTPLVVTNHLANQCWDITVTFQIGVTGSGPFTYLWYKDNVRIPAATGPAHTIQFPGEEDLGTYRVIVIDAFGTSVTESASLLDCF